MKKLTFGRILCLLLFILQLLAEIFSFAAIARLDMLPDKYSLPLIGVYLLGLLTTGLLIFIPSRKPKGGKLRRVLACILAVVIIILCTVAFVVASDVYETIHAITQKPDNTITRQVYVVKEDRALTLEDARDYTFGIVSDYDTEYTQLAIDEIEKILGQSIRTMSFTTVPEMVDALYSGQCNAIILNGGYVGILENLEAYVDFSDRTRILHHVPIDPTMLPGTDASEPSQPDETTPSVPESTVPPEPAGVTNTPFIMYISGSDTRSTYLTVSLSDVNILAVVNPQTKQVLLLNTPRDYYIPNPAGSGRLDKLTHCGVYGIDCSINALSSLYDINIDYYSRINFTGFKTMIDAIGGVTVYSNAGFTREGITIYKGENHLNGEAALIFARERYLLAGGDNARGQNQMKVIKAMIQKLTSGTTIISNYAQILDSMEGMFVTSMEMTEISQLVKMQLEDLATWNVQTFAVTGNNGREVTYSMPGQALSVMYQNEKYIAHAKTLVQKVLAGEILTDDDLKLPS